MNEALLRYSLTSAKTRAFAVYTHSKERSGAERSGIFALGHYEGLKDALRLMERQSRDTLQAAFVGPLRPPAPSLMTIPPFSAIFQKLRPKHGPSALGRW
jgi:hypothetical protein